MTSSDPEPYSAGDRKCQRSASTVLMETRPFASDNASESWWKFWTTGIIMVGLLVVAGIAPWWPMRLLSSLLGALVMVRMFIIYHDFMHGAVLRNSLLARILLHLYGYLLLVPAKAWRKSHNYHHAHVGMALVSNTGSFPLMTTAMWHNASWIERLSYRVSRSPVIILGAYLTVFAWSLTIEPLFRHPLKHWDSALALGLHGGLITSLWWIGGPDTAIYSFLLPLVIAEMLGAYLFYAQHNFPGVKILRAEEWTNYRASLQTSSHLKLGRLLRWFTGDIGYHHVHHLNLAIPFYRLADAMDAIPELQRPVITTLNPRDIIACLRLKLWDEASERMVSFREIGPPNTETKSSITTRKCDAAEMMPVSEVNR